MTDDKTLEVRVQPTDELRKETLEKIQALEQGEETSDMHVLNLPSERELSRLMSEKNLELLHAISDHEPSSIRELARLVDRDYKEVHRNVMELEQLNVVEFRQEGRSKRPILEYDNIEINVDLTTPA